MAEEYLKRLQCYIKGDIKKEFLNEKNQLGVNDSELIRKVLEDRYKKAPKPKA